jgi:hypothetical protein
MAAKVTRLTDKIAIQQRLVAESCTICSSRSRRSASPETFRYTLVFLFAPIYFHDRKISVLTARMFKKTFCVWMSLHLSVMLCNLMIIRLAGLYAD